MFPRDAVEHHLEKAFYDQQGMSTKFKLRKSTMRYKNGDTSHATDIIQIHGTQGDKFKANGFLLAFFLKNELRSHGFNRAAFTPMNMLAGSTNVVHRSQCLSAHQKFLNDHKAILLRGVSLTDWEEDATPEMCKEVLSQKAYVENNLKSNSLFDLFFNYLVDMRTGPVALGAYKTPGGSTTLFIAVPHKRVNNTFEALNQVSLSQYRNIFFSEPIHSFLPPACHAYLSKGTNKASRQEITNREYSRRINLEKEFPSFTIKKKHKQPPKPSQHPAPARRKTYASATTPKTAPVTNQQQYHQADPNLAAMSAENERLKEENRALKKSLEKSYSDIRDLLEQRDENMASINKGMAAMYSMQEGLMDYLKLPSEHLLQQQFRRTVVYSDQCTEHQKVADEEVEPPLYEEPPSPTHRPRTHSVHKHQQSSLSARHNMYMLANEPHLSGQKRNLSPNHRERDALMNKRLPQSESVGSDTEMDTDSANIQTGALGSSEASEMQ